MKQYGFSELFCDRRILFSVARVESLVWNFLVPSSRGIKNGGSKQGDSCRDARLLIWTDETTERYARGDDRRVDFIGNGFLFNDAWNVRAVVIRKKKQQQLIYGHLFK